MRHTSQMPHFGRLHRPSRYHSGKVELEVDDRLLLVL
jgi:hypothetical protein